MMRTLFISSTIGFWLAVGVFWGASVWLPNEAAGPSSVGTEKTLTLVDVARHHEAKDCWMAIDGTVYNLTVYLPQHPSNPAVILQWCGKEATEAYQTKNKGRPHSSRADQLLSTFAIGKLIPPR
jgi:cytochrome b involved in lipid metabolism